MPGQSFKSLIALTVLYAAIFVAGTVGNLATCLVIAKNKPMHTATNYYLFNLAVSDLLLLVAGLPVEIARLWSPARYPFGGFHCVAHSFAAEAAANAAVLTITAFSVERYLAICQPLLAYALSQSGRAVRIIAGIWLLAGAAAAPQALQFGLLSNGTKCTITTQLFQHSFEASTALFFVGPVLIITALYGLIAARLRRRRRAFRGARRGAQVVRMLIAVVAVFVLSWAPFHAQRLLAVYLSSCKKPPAGQLVSVYVVLTHVSGVLYFISTAINPLLYNIMSRKFREAFKKTFTRTTNSRFSNRAPLKNQGVSAATGEKNPKSARSVVTNEILQWA